MSLDNVQFLAQLVWGKTGEFTHDFNCLLKQGCWADLLSPTELADPTLNNIMFVLVVNAAAEFHVPIVEKLVGIRNAC